MRPHPKRTRLVVANYHLEGDLAGSGGEAALVVAGPASPSIGRPLIALGAYKIIRFLLWKSVQGVLDRLANELLQFSLNGILVE